MTASSRYTLAEDYQRGLRVGVNGHVLAATLLYPRSENHLTEVEVDMECVRACDSLRISYDFGRDGWSIKQASTFSWNADDEVCDMDWQEVAFVQAWGRYDENTSQPGYEP